MKLTLIKSDSRGGANYGWLNANYSFSFANYHDPQRIHFGVLRVLNDDTIAAGKGFDTHPHDNMEIVTIPLSGELQHKDSMGNSAVIRAGEVQVMSAGTGIQHSEFNHSQSEELKLFQIWIFPNKQNVSPRYDQISIKEVETPNAFFQVLSPNQDDQGVWIHQNAWFHMGQFEAGKIASYQLKDPDNGIYLMLIEGNVSIGEHQLSRRDAISIEDVSKLEIRIIEASYLLLMEVPMQIS